MIFVVNNGFTSAILRGDHIATTLGVPCKFSELGNERNGVVVFVKEADRGLALDAKDRGNRIVYDPIDLHCYKERVCPFADIVDVLIVPNSACREFYRPLYPKASFAVIPHQWDYRISGMAPRTELRTGYIGKGFNCPQEWTGAKVTNSPDMLAAASRFNLHIALNQRIEKHILLKPATKVSTAAAVGANAVTYADPSAVELLGSDYPYLVQDDPRETILEAQRSFGSVTWKRALDRMRQVKQWTSLEAVAALFARLQEGELEKAA